MDESRITSVGINVGSQTNPKEHGRGPIYSDGSFEYVPITERDETVDYPTYGDLENNASIVQEHLDDVAHFDPEFPEFGPGENYTYGDPGKIKRRSLSKLSQGDYVFFYGTLDYDDDRPPERYWINDNWGGYIFGHFRLAVDPIVGEDAYQSAPEDIKSALENNAHLRRNELDENIVFILGDPIRSVLYETPIPLSLPATTLTTAAKANHLFEMDGADKKSAWHRGPIEFNQDVTEVLLQCYQSDRYLPIMGDPLVKYPGFHDFEYELGSTEDLDKLDSFLESNDLTEEERLLTSFLYIAGGWSIEVPRSVLEKADRPIETPASLLDDEDIPEVLTRTFESLRGTGWPHNHRTNIPRAAGRLRPDKQKDLEPYITEILLDAVESLAGETDSLSKMIQELENSKVPFDDGMTRFKRVSSFSRLAAFDLLEVLVRSNGREQLKPNCLKKEYIDSSGPKSGFEHVFGLSLDDAEEARRIQHLTQLVAYACEEYEMSVADAIFSVESALCNCQKGRTHSELTDLGYSTDEVEDVDRSQWNC